MCANADEARFLSITLVPDVGDRRQDDAFVRGLVQRAFGEPSQAFYRVHAFSHRPVSSAGVRLGVI